ncbi:DNA cytosine methyltransferase [Caulobacter sp. Root655]|uniref:DNA cytosine methyltransferase n=1 Tax=Caulobacter sp. Root655 TaxID=1736578 RepID=UPI0009E8E753|nr:DNA cytosine methyltransferase [Caulobacter sp. Root655]
MNRNASPVFYEFFAGGGMARLGLGEAWTCAFANDFDPVKAATYRDNHPGAADHFHEGDVWKIAPADLPGQADLAWASSPCQDFSLAGARAGLQGGRSSAFFGFWKLMEALSAEGRAPRTIVVENVVGLLTSHGGKDFQALCQALADQGYAFGAIEIDAAKFVPQSRPRVFVIATREPPPPAILGSCSFQTTGICMAFARLPSHLRAKWLWWNLPLPPPRNTDLASVLEEDSEVHWHNESQSDTFLALMGPSHRTRVEELAALPGRKVGAAFRRMRQENGQKHQRLEVRFDGIAGCLRVPSGGSSRQSLVIVENQRIRSRLISSREGARLMGLPDTYKLPKSTISALHVIGDGVVVDVVKWIKTHVLERLLYPTTVAESPVGKIEKRPRSRASGF